MPVEPSERTSPQDLQASAPEVRIGLSRAGVTGVRKAVRMQHGGEDALVAAVIDCFVDLDPAQKGVHMSRFPELFEEAIDETVIGEGSSVRPGSWTGAKARDGLSGNLRDPTRVHASARRHWDRRLNNDPGPMRPLYPPGSAGISDHEARRNRVGPGSEPNK